MRGKKISIIFLFLLAPLAYLHAQLTAGGDTTICRGGQAQLWASGGGASYHWTAYPTDPSLLIPQQQNPIVSPSQNTMYVVQSNVATGNLILNGSFELGNAGFNSEYVYNPNSIVDEGTYAVVSDAHTVHSAFFCNQDHTSGSGLFMAVNGSGTPNTKVWYLSLTNIQPNTDYEFSTWITSLHSSNPAVLQFSINGQLMAEPFNAYSSTCDWYQFFHVWNSGANTQATISIVNQNTVPSGNDFALDDISFATVLVYYDTVWVEVLPQLTSGFTVVENACTDQVVNIEFTGNGSDTNTFHWDFDGATVLSGSGLGPYEVAWSSAGDYNVTLWVEDEDACSSDTTVHNVSVVGSPVSGVTADQTVLLAGETTTLHGTMSGGSGNLSFSWSPENLVSDPLSQDPETLPLDQTTTFVFTVFDEITQCSSVSQVTIVIQGGNLSATAFAVPPVICYGASCQLQGSASGGTGDYSYSWSSDPPWFESDIQNPLVYPEESTTFILEVNDGIQVTTSSIYVEVRSLPVADAGIDQTIPYGTATTLDGLALNGSGDYSYHWEPASLLIDPSVPDPGTVALSQNTMFTLYVTDMGSSCESEKDTVLVMMDGGPLSVTIFSDHEVICSGDTAMLTAGVSGGLVGNYTYSWEDENGNLLSEEPAVQVTPVLTTTYFLTVTDGFSTLTEPYELAVNPAPVFTVNNDQEPLIFCPYDSAVLRIDPSPPEWDYLWSNGSVGTEVVMGTTGIGFDSKTITVRVTSENGCEVEREIVIYFDFSACLGLEEEELNMLKVFPNPARQDLIVEWPQNKRLVMLEVKDIYGRNVHPVIFPTAYQNNAAIRLGQGFQSSHIVIIRAYFEDRVMSRKTMIIR